MAENDGVIIVTGSNGRIGRAVMQRFAGRFPNVVGLDRSAPEAPPPGCVSIPIEITSDDSVKEGLRILHDHHGTRVASVIHLAAYYDFFGAPSTLYDEVTVQGTGRLLRGLQENHFQVDQFVFSSTMLVHKPAEPGEFITEDWPIEPTWAYPESKVRTEQLIHEQRGDIPAVLLRIAGVYDDLCHSIPLAHQIQRIYQRQFTSRVYSGSTAHGQSFLHMDDLVDAIEQTVMRRHELSPEIPILLGEPQPLSYDELQHTFARLIHGANWETLEVPGPLAPFAKAGAYVLEKMPGGDPFIKPWMIDRANDHYALDIARAKTSLGWKPERSLRLTIPLMVAALKADPVAFFKENDLELPSELKEAEQVKTSEEEKGGNRKGKHMTGMDMKDGDVAAAPAESGTPMQHGSNAVWPHFANMVLGLWLITSAFALGYRSSAIQASDITSGALIILLATLTLSQSKFWQLWAPWSISLVGVWLLFAPLIFWARDSAAYSNDTLAGALAIVFAVLAPGMPGMRMMPGPDVPRGWSYNPSSWPQRAPIIALALLGFFLSRHMAAFQLQHITSIRDPLFGMGTQSVLTSSVSRAFPISDAGFGGIAYMIEFLMGFMGDKRRWRTMPWMVTFFGILVVPLGVVSITLIILQPLAVGAWCTPCLIAATAMVIMIALTLDEVVATGQFLLQAKREGQPLWRTFWAGGTVAEVPEAGPVHPDVVKAKALVWGVALPWNLLAIVAIGIWLMFGPFVFGTTGKAAHSEHLFGALIVTAAIIALADVGRATRFINVLFGAWVIAAPWLLGGATSGSRWSDLSAGALVILLSFRRGPVGERYGSWT